MPKASAHIPSSARNNTDPLAVRNRTPTAGR
jgi:hypothetical protein